MMLKLLLFYFNIFLLFSFILCSNYCATISSNTASGSIGYFSASIFNGTGTYSFSLDLTSFNTGTCDLSKGLTYHFHTYWNNNTVTSSSNSYCGASYTGFHFDPNFACGPNSQDANTGKCAALNRTTTSKPPYVYSCNPTNYQNGRYAYCETGDISNKFGYAFAKPGTRIFEELNPLVDYQPPYDANYKQGDAMSYQWQSIVFHCAETNARLVCAEFIKTDEKCGNSISNDSKDDDNDPWSTGEWNSLAKLLVGLFVGIAVVGAVAGFFIWKNNNKSEPNRGLLNLNA